ncbi:MAG: radical SAM family protein [uncultured bacterium (gcode 4)]|uniref:Radical SAM family protein n=1 Tax=uncultured bacterium (gcode 4) TaxID=1234023 RepID=K1X5W5_9BACT|nr:MAG: radical SAM family protein [uncultured bacterium (gcode 4)]
MYYKIKDNVLWRNEKNSFMILHPVSKKLMIFWKDISDFVSKWWIIDGFKLKDNVSIKYLIKESIVADYLIDFDINNHIFWSDNFVSAPLNVTIQITNRCNLQCGHCHKVDKWCVNIDKDRLITLIDELHEMKVFNINISWWEPLMYEWLSDVIKYIVSKWMKITMSTNLVLWDENMANTMHQLWVRQLHVSLDSSDETYHDHMRWHKGAYLTTIKNLAIIKKAGLTFTLVTTLVNQSIDDYSKIIDLSYKLWASWHKTNILVPQWQWKSIETWYYKDLNLFKSYIRVFLQKKKKYDKKMSVIWESMFMISIWENMDNKPDILKLWCPAGVLTCAITEKWNLLACPFYTELSMWNIYDDSFKDLWTKSVLLWKIRVCKENDGSWCQARAYWISKSIENNDPYIHKNVYDANNHDFYNNSAENRNDFISVVWHWIKIEWEKWNKEFYWLIHNYLMSSDLTLEIWTWTWIVPKTLGCLWKKIISIDFSDNMLKLAKENCSMYDNVLFMKEDIHALTFRDGNFDLIIKRLAPDDLWEIFRVLKFGWNFINFTNWERDWMELKELFWFPFHQSVSDYKSQLVKQWFEMIYEDEFEFKEIYNDFDILIKMLHIAPIIPDFLDREAYYIDKIKTEFDDTNCFVLTRHKYLVNAKK